MEPRPHSSIQTKAWGTTPYGAQDHRAPYKRRLFGARAPHSLDAVKEVLGRLLEALDGLQDGIMGSRSS